MSYSSHHTLTQKLTISSIQVNVISPILLTFLLAPILERTRNKDKSPTNPYIPRVVFTGSVVTEAAATASLDPEHPLAGLNDKGKFTISDRYFQSKVSLPLAPMSI